MATTYEITERANFATILRAHRAAGTIRAYGRLGAFGRSLITTEQIRILFPYWTPQPPLNIHPKGGAR